MEKPVEAPGKYQLKSLHEEIGLCDRKLAHLEKYETFASAELRQSAIARMTTKRAKLVKTAQKLSEEGVEFLPSELPRSLRAASEIPAESTEQAAVA